VRAAGAVRAVTPVPAAGSEVSGGQYRQAESDAHAVDRRLQSELLVFEPQLASRA